MLSQEEQLRRWRQEIEATLAFEPEEIDELEDHLRSSLERSRQAGATPEDAWREAQDRLGPSPSLALEFAKSKLLPALLHLLRAWLKPGLLLFLLTTTFDLAFNAEADSSGASEKQSPGLWFWGLLWVSFAALLILLPRKVQKNALLLGTGNALCLLPMLHALFYNPAWVPLIGAGWGRLVPLAGGWPLVVGLTGFVVINAWWWMRIRTSRGDLSELLTLMVTIVFVAALAPCCGEWVGNLAMMEVYDLPSSALIPFTGETRNQFVTYKFVAVLIESLVFIANLLPWILVLVAATGVILVQSVLRQMRVGASVEARAFPGSANGAWLLGLVGSGVAWGAASAVEGGFSRQLAAMKAQGFVSSSHGGLDATLLLSAAVFLVCAFELTRRLERTLRLRPYFASLIVVVELLVLGFIIWTTSADSGLPRWVSWLLGLAVLYFAVRQSRMIWEKRGQVLETSVWKFDGDDLVEKGLVLGLVLACAGTILWEVAQVIAYISVVYIHAMIDWGRSVALPPTGQFHPQTYGYSDTLACWVFASPAYLCFCLIAGLGSIMALSGLEFIRFNTYRFYRVRKAGRSGQVAKTPQFRFEP